MIGFMRDRLDQYHIREQYKYFNQNELMKQIMDASGVPMLIVNSYRQMVYANESFLKSFGGKIDDFLGKRAGEIIKCTFSYECLTGCGTSRACESCNLLKTVNEGLFSNFEATNIATIPKKNNFYSSNLNFKVKAKPIHVDDETYIAVSLSDMNDNLKKLYMEKSLIRDVEKSVSTLMDTMNDSSECSKDYIGESELTKVVLSKIIDEVSYQKQISDAESNKLKLNVTEIDVNEIIVNQVKYLNKICKMDNKPIKINVITEPLKVKSDKALVNRILNNMLKNAIEATEKGGVITVGCNTIYGGSRVEFWVKNDKYIDKSHQWRVFENTFSTKGEGRGFGTYYLKLFAEKFLAGEANFESTPENGTRFYVRLPIIR